MTKEDKITINAASILADEVADFHNRLSLLPGGRDKLPPSDHSAISLKLKELAGKLRVIIINN